MAKQRIAIVGGGMAALATAFELSQREDQRERFDITIYQMGWRLGERARQVGTVKAASEHEHWRVRDFGAQILAYLGYQRTEV